MDRLISGEFQMTTNEEIATNYIQKGKTMVTLDTLYALERLVERGQR